MVSLLLSIYLNQLLPLAISGFSLFDLVLFNLRLPGTIAPFHKGKGALRKYFWKNDRGSYLIKKTNFLIEHRTYLLGKYVHKKEEYLFPSRFSYLQNLMHYSYFRNCVLLNDIKKSYLVYRYLPNVKSLSEQSLSLKVKEKLFKEIFEFYLFLKKKGYYSQELFLHNILYDGQKLWFIDLEGIVPITKDSTGEVLLENLRTSFLDT
jgi:hypothetical protein